MSTTTSTATARAPYGPPVRRVAFGAIEPQGHRVGLFGPGGIGKTTLAATAPGPVGFIDLDDSLPILRPSLGELDIRRVSGIAGWQDMRDALHSDGWDDVRTIVIDSATKAEELSLEWTIRNVKHEKDGVVIRRIEDYGFGKGYQHNYETFLTLLSDLDQHVRAGRNVVLICHDCTATVPNPKGEDYIRWEPRLQNPSSGKASIRLRVREWLDHLLYKDVPLDQVIQEQKVVGLLKAEGVTTLGAYCDWRAAMAGDGGHYEPLLTFKGIGQAKADKVADQVIAWWAQAKVDHPRWGEDPKETKSDDQKTEP